MERILHFNIGWLDNKNSYNGALTVHGLIFGRAYYRKDFCLSDLGVLLSGGLIPGGLILRILPYDNEVALACSVNALIFYPLCRYKKCDSQHVVLK